MEEWTSNIGDNCEAEPDLFELVMETVDPWVKDKNSSQWRIHANCARNEQRIVSVINERSKMQFAALICCLEQPEIVAVSFTDGKLGWLNPYLDGGQKIERDLDGPGCWNVLAITIPAEEGAQVLRYVRGGEEFEVRLNEFGSFSIVDWHSNHPVEEYLAVKIDGEWRKPIVSVLPYSIEHVALCWKNAVNNSKGLQNRWNRWITAAFTELGGDDRAKLQKALMEEFSKDCDEQFYLEFKAERRRFLRRESLPLDELMQNA